MDQTLLAAFIFARVMQIFTAICAMRDGKCGLCKNGFNSAFLVLLILFLHFALFGFVQEATFAVYDKFHNAAIIGCFIEIVFWDFLMMPILDIIISRFSTKASVWLNVAQ